VPDQWQIQIQAKIQADARVVMHTSYLTDAELAAAHLQQTADVADAVQQALSANGPNARVCVLPEGPQTIPYITAQA
jgi:nickel-dependent lactate racemase